MHGFEEKFNLAVVETYGISEAGSTIFANPVPPKKRKAGSVGLPAGIEAKLCEPESLRTVNTGEIGEVVIKGENVISSYMYDRGKDSFMGGWFRTGDLGYFDDDGYLFLTGRKKDIIIRGGENIFPREIEEAIMLDSNIREAAVVGKPDDIYGEKTVAFIVSKHGFKDETDLKNSLQSRLTKTKLPDEYFFLEEMPKTKTNKIDKVRLRGMAV
jgi:acyl-CoA synthetase (AMP-forming)/AMP-acid ligase II